MKILVCDICKLNVREGDVRYVNVTKPGKGEDGNPKDIPVMTEREICVHCAENIKSYIDGMPYACHCKPGK